MCYFIRMNPKLISLFDYSWQMQRILGEIHLYWIEHITNQSPFVTWKSVVNLMNAEQMLTGRMGQTDPFKAEFCPLRFEDAVGNDFMITCNCRQTWSGNSTLIWNTGTVAQAIGQLKLHGYDVSIFNSWENLCQFCWSLVEI